MACEHSFGVCEKCAPGSDGPLAEALRHDEERSAPNPFVLKRMRREILERAASGGSSLRPSRRSKWFVLGVGAAAVASTAFAGWLVWPSTDAAPSEALVASRRTLDLGEGEFEFDIKPGEPKVLLRVPDGEIVDVGTRFSVSVKGQTTMKIQVAEGEVLFRRPGQAPLRVVAGMTYRAPEAGQALGAEVGANGSSTSAIASAPVGSAAVASASPSTPSPLGTVGVTASSPASSVAQSSNPGSIAARSAGTVAERPRPPARGPLSVESHGRTSASDRRRSATPSAPASPNEDALYLSWLEAVRAGRKEEARALRARYLEAFPDGFRRTEVLATTVGE